MDERWNPQFTVRDVEAEIPNNLQSILNITVALENTLRRTEGGFDTFNANDDIHDLIVYRCYKVCFLVDSIVRADPRYGQPFSEFLDSVAGVLKARDMDPIDPDNELFWNFANNAALDIADVCGSLVNQMSRDGP